MKVTSPGRPQDVYTQSLVGPFVWDGTQITFSFPKKAQYTGYDGEDPVARYGAFSDQQMDAVRTILASISSFTNLTFVELGGARAGDATLRFANTAATDTAFAFYPSASDMGGDAWFARTAEMQSPDLSSYAYFSILHEIGHALGLMHPHEPEIGTAMPLDRDWLSYTVMSYRDDEGAGTVGYRTEDGDYPQTYMMEDIAALQFAYGANFSYNAGDTVYMVDPDTAELFVDGVSQGVPLENSLLRTIWDGGGVDTYDFSNFRAPVSVNLEPGEWVSTPSQNVGRYQPYFAAGTLANAHLHNGDTRSLIENVIGTRGEDRIQGNQADNRLDGGSGSDRIYGAAGNDQIIGGTGDDWLYGDEGDDTLKGNAGTNFLYGGAGDDVLIAGASGRIMEGGAGNDRLVGGRLGNVMDGGDGNDILLANGGFSQMSGGRGDDILRGSKYDDRLDGGTGADRMYGGAGDDVYLVDSLSDIVVEHADEGYDTVLSFVSVVLSANVEKGDLTGKGNRSLTGNALDNILWGNPGNNRIDGGSGADAMAGGQGDDTYYVDSALDQIYEFMDEGYDRVIATGTVVLRPTDYVEYIKLVGASSINAFCDDADNEVVGNRARNVISGMGGNDHLSGMSGDDRIDGGSGNDWISGGVGADLLQGGFGSDTILGDEGADRLFGHDGHDWLYGGIANDKLVGAEGNDRLFGEAGNDYLYGDAGRDRVSGGAGRDIVWGGADADWFVFAEGDFAGTRAHTADAIRDFSHADGDKIDLLAIDAVPGGERDGFVWIGQSQFSGNGGELRWESLSSGVLVTIDHDGDGVTDYAIYLSGIDTIAKSDFLL